MPGLPSRAIGAFAAVIAVVSVGGGAVSAADIAACAPDAAAETATVAAVIDGGTLRLADGRVVRLAGIEAPRRPLAVADEEPWPLTEVARAGLERLTAGKAVQVVPVAEAPDRHGRWRANLYLGAGNEWLQSVLVAAGLARVHRLPGDPRCVFALLGAEKAAREGRLGLWRSPDYAVLQAGDPSLQGRTGLYELVEGRVARVGHGAYMIFLDFGRDYWRDFTIMISPRVAESLASAGVPADGLAGRPIRVRGVIEASGGPAIRVNDPAEIELLNDGDNQDGAG